MTAVDALLTDPAQLQRWVAAMRANNAAVRPERLRGGEVRLFDAFVDALALIEKLATEKSRLLGELAVADERLIVLRDLRAELDAAITVAAAERDTVVALRAASEKNFQQALDAIAESSRLRAALAEARELLREAHNCIETKNTVPGPEWGRLYLAWVAALAAREPTQEETKNG